MLLEDESGKQLNAITVFGLMIRSLKEDLLKEYQHHLANGSIETKEIHWVITVPAIWNEPAKQFVREAAIKAGLIYCLKIRQCYFSIHFIS